MVGAFVFCTALPHLFAGEQPPKRLLLITGHDVPAHDWRATTAVTRKILETDGRFQVVVSEEPAVLESQALFSYDAVLLNYRNSPRHKLSEKARQQLSRFVSSGKGLIAIHFAVSAWGDWQGFREMLGRSWKGRRAGGPSGHAPRGPLRVQVASGTHPLAEGLTDFDTDDELYAQLVGETPIRVVATAKSEFSGQDEPVAWTLDHAQGRIFVLVLGHDVAARKTAGFQELLRRGAGWASRSGK